MGVYYVLSYLRARSRPKVALYNQGDSPWSKPYVSNYFKKKKYKHIGLISYPNLTSQLSIDLVIYMRSLILYLSTRTCAFTSRVTTYTFCNSCLNLVHYRFQLQGLYNYMSHLKIHYE